ncbi:hypothetical protein APHAL10511_003015 [Amanita phalloides]|nr:hypothetical protein APHAL10511_003015 [Amanita phalloides]
MGRSDKKSAKTSPASSSSQDIVPAPKTNRIPAIYLEQLTAIWEADKRLPSAESRRAWSLARGIEPARVNNWWYRKKTTARKHGVFFPEGTYELPVGTVPKPPSSSGAGAASSRRFGLGINLGDIKSEELEFKFEVAPPDDDPTLGLNPISSGSSDVLGSLDSDDYQQTSTGSPYTPAGTAFSTLNGCRNAAEMINSNTIGAYNRSMPTDFTSWNGFDKLFGFGGSYMLSDKPQFGTFAYDNDTVATEKQGPLYEPGPYEQASYDSIVGSLCEETIRAWGGIEENGHTKLQLVLPEPCQKHDSPTATQDPANFSWCLGGKRYSPDGFFWGLCECSGLPEVFLFKRFVGCTGPWEDWSISELDSGDSDT